ncbi:MAG: PrsW family glutamic-type intramembrane protease [Clostridia bacterium]
MTVGLISLALIPVVILIAFIYLADRHNREPARLLWKVFLYGFLVSVPVIGIQFFLIRLNFFPGLLSMAFQAFIIAALTEEYMKRFVVVKIAYRNPAFDEKLDGIIYCAFAALGFAAIENILYVFRYFPSDPSIAFYRAIFSVPGHMLFAITMGYYLALSKFAGSPGDCRRYYGKSLLYPVLLHGTFNFILSTEVSFLLVFLPFVIFMWIFNMKKLNAFYRESKANHS